MQQDTATASVPRLNKFKSIILFLSKITHEMWHDHTFSQSNKTTRRAGGGIGQN